MVRNVVDDEKECEEKFKAFITMISFNNNNLGLCFCEASKGSGMGAIKRVLRKIT